MEQRTILEDYLYHILATTPDRKVLLVSGQHKQHLPTERLVAPNSVQRCIEDWLRARNLKGQQSVLGYRSKLNKNTLKIECKVN